MIEVGFQALNERLEFRLALRLEFRLALRLELRLEFKFELRLELMPEFIPLRFASA